MMKKQFTVYGVVDQNKNLIVDRTSFYSSEDMASAVVNQMNEFNEKGEIRWSVEKFILTEATS